MASNGHEIARLFSKIGFEVDFKQLNRYEKRIKNLQGDFNTFGKRVEKSTEPLKKQAQALSALEKRYNKHSGTLSQIYRDYKKVNSEYKRGNLSLEKRKRLLNEIAGKYREVKSQALKANAAEDRVGNARAGVVPFKRGIGGGSSGLIAFGGLAAAATAAGFALEGLRQAALASNEIFQRQQRAITALQGTSGNRDAARSEYKRLTAFSNRYGVRADSTIEAYNQLKGQAQPAGISDKNTNKVFEALVALSKARGLSNENVSGAIAAFSQIASKGQVYSKLCCLV